MTVSVTCRACGLSFKVHSRFAGKVGTCPRPECGRKFLVPTAEPAVAAEVGASTDRPRSPSPKAGSRSAATADHDGDDVNWLYQHAGVEQDKPSPTGTPARKPASRPQQSRRNVVASSPGVLSRLLRNPRWLASMAAGVALFVTLAVFLFTRGPSETDAPQVASSDAAGETPQQAAVRAIAEEKARTQAAAFTSHVEPYLKKFCLDCHTGDNSEAGIVLDRFANEDAARKDRKTWEKVVRMLEAGAMPPGDHPQRPTADETKPVVAWMDERVFRVDCSLPGDPGRVTVRRLNRNEYNNTVRDLLGVSFRPADDFPSDDVGYGFDNIGDVLSLPPLLMEKYLDAAEKIAEATIVVADPKGTVQRSEGEDLERSGQFQVNEDNAVGLFSAGNVSKKFHFPAKGEYILRIEAAADQAGDEAAKVELQLDGKPFKTFSVTGQRKMTTFDTKLTVDSGQHTLLAAFTNDYYNPKAKNPKDRDRNLYVKSLEVQGPIGGSPNLPDSHRRIVVAKPDGKLALRDAAQQVLRPLSRKAFRRPVSDAELEPFVKLVEFAQKQGDSYERGLQVALQGLLVSPHFLFRIERDADPNNAKSSRSLNDYELASRLSYFLWSSMPDEELFRLAEKNELHAPETLQAQTKRMLSDPKSKAFVENFGGQWLNLRNLDDLQPDPKLFPDFNPALRSDMRKETELFFESIVREDRSLLDFLDGRYTFLNDRLAKHYGLPSPGGNEFKKVNLDDARRGGILTQASILTLTSDPTKTSPVKRGKWILDNLLGAPPPPPPAGVPELAETQKANPKASLRQQLEIHRKNPACATCHQQMDPLGLGFENFDAIGRWREMDNGHKVDSSGKLPSGETFQGPAELRTILKSREKQFTKHFAGQLLTYALGRGLDPSDRCTIDTITEAAQTNNHRFSVLVHEVVKSETFQKRRGESPAE